MEPEHNEQTFHSAVPLLAVQFLVMCHSPASVLSYVAKPENFSPISRRDAFGVCHQQTRWTPFETNPLNPPPRCFGNVDCMVHGYHSVSCMPQRSSRICINLHKHAPSVLAAPGWKSGKAEPPNTQGVGSNQYCSPHYAFPLGGAKFIFQLGWAGLTFKSPASPPPHNPALLLVLTDWQDSLGLGFRELSIRGDCVTR